MPGNSTYFISASIWPEEIHAFVLLCSCPWPGGSCRLHIKVGNGVQLHGHEFGLWPPRVSASSVGAIRDCYLSLISKSVLSSLFLTERTMSERKTRQQAWDLGVPNTAHSLPQMVFLPYSFSEKEQFLMQNQRETFAYFWLSKFLCTGAAFTFSQS